MRRPAQRARVVTHHMNRFRVLGFAVLNAKARTFHRTLSSLLLLLLLQFPPSPSSSGGARLSPPPSCPGPSLPLLSSARVERLGNATRASNVDRLQPGSSLAPSDWELVSCCSTTSFRRTCRVAQNGRPKKKSTRACQKKNVGGNHFVP